MHPDSGTKQLPLVQWIATGVIAVLAVAIIVAQPLYHDHAIYWRGGEVLLDGRTKLADDYLVKQPLIYLFFALAKLLFGDHEWSYRLLDALYQLGTASALALVANRIGGAVLAATSAGAYLLVYSASAYVLAAHPESLAGLLLALLALGRMHPRNHWLDPAWEGLLLTALVWLKLTFLLVAPALLLFDIIERRSAGQVAKEWAIALLAVFISSAGGLLLLANTIEWSSVPAALEYLRFYGTQPPIGPAIVNAWHNLIRSAAENFTITMTALAGIGIGLLTRRANRNVVLWALLSLAMSASIIIERKFGVVHLWRLLPCLTIPLAVGPLWTVRTMTTLWKSSFVTVRLTMLPLAGAAIAFSPIPRFLHSLAVPIYALTDTERYNDAYQRTAHNVLHRRTLWDIAGFIRSSDPTADRVLILSSCMSQLYVFLHQPQWHHFSTTMPIFAQHVPLRWRALYWQDIRRADWLVVSTLDRAEPLFGHGRSSWESLYADTASAHYVQAHFRVAMTTPIARVLKRTVSDVSP